MCNLDPKTIDVMLKQLEKNQASLREDYVQRIEDISKKLDKVSDKLDNLSNQFVTRAEFEYCKEKVAKVEDRWNKIIWIIITAVIGAVLSLVLIHNP